MHQLSFIETSALDSTNVEEAFVNVLTEIYENHSQKQIFENSNGSRFSAGGNTIQINETDEKSNPNISCCNK